MTGACFRDDVGQTLVPDLGPGHGRARKSARPQGQRYPRASGGGRSDTPFLTNLVPQLLSFIMLEGNYFYTSMKVHINRFYKLTLNWRWTSLTDKNRVIASSCSLQRRRSSLRKEIDRVGLNGY